MAGIRNAIVVTEALDNQVYGWVQPDSPQIGWGGVNKPDEADFVGDAGRHGLFTIPANHTVNLSTLLGLK